MNNKRVILFLGFPFTQFDYIKVLKIFYINFSLIITYINYDKAKSQLFKSRSNIYLWKMYK